MPTTSLNVSFPGVRGRCNWTIHPLTHCSVSIVDPVWGEEAAEGCHEDQTAVVRDRLCELGDLVGCVAEAHVVHQKLHAGARHCYATFQCVDGCAVEVVGYGGEETVLRDDGLLADVVEQEAAGAVGVLGFTRLEALLAYQSGGLVAQAACQAKVLERAACDLAEGLGVCGADNLGHVHFAQIELVRKEVEHLFAVPERVDVHEHGAACVGRIRDEDLLFGAAIELVHEPGVDGAEGEVAGFVRFAHFLLVLQQPKQLGHGGVGGDGQAADVGQLVTAGTGFELTSESGGSSVGPYDGVVERFAGLDVPDDSRFSLVGDANGFDTVFGVTVLFEDFEGALDAVLDGLDNLVWVVFVPSTSC